MGVITALIVALGVANMARSEESPLATHKWEERVLVVRAASGNEGRELLEKQLAMTRDADTRRALAERDLVLYWSQGNRGERLDFTTQPVQVTSLQASERRALDEALEAREVPWRAHSFVMVLVGKDGELKRQVTQPSTFEGFFALIDTMPMRRREMRERAD